MYDQNTNAILLLCSHFSKAKSDEGRPLTPLEYGRLAKWLHEQGSLPSDLMLNFDERIETWKDPKGKITRNRVKALLDRGMALALTLEKWERVGIWVVTRRHKEYPKRLKQRLEWGSPALFYGVGNRQLLNAGGVGIVGSRGIDESDKHFTEEIAKQAALEGLNVVSGGAKGVDETAMLGALSVEGTAVGILADSLLKASVASKWRDSLLNNQLALISPFYPEARFQVGNAMARNKYIYCMADYGLVVRSDKGRGGTWSGATENMKKQWVPLFVKPKSDAEGNAALIDQGARELQFDMGSDRNAKHEPLRALFSSGTLAEKVEEKPGLIKSENIDKKSTEFMKGSGGPGSVTQASEHQKSSLQNESVTLSDQPQKQHIESSPDAFYSLFVQLVHQLLNENPEINMSKFSENFPDITQKQLTHWFDRAVDEGLLRRKGRLRTYVLCDDAEQAEMF